MVNVFDILMIQNIRHFVNVIQDGQAAKRGSFTHRDVATLGPVRAGEQFYAVRFEPLQTWVAQAFHRLVDAVQIDVHALAQRSSRQAEAAVEVGMLGRHGNQQAEFFPAQRHAAG